MDEPSQGPKTAIPHWLGMTVFQNGVGALLAFLLGSKGCLSFAPAADLKNACLALCLYIIICYILMYRQGMSKFLNVEIFKSPGETQIGFVENINRSFQNALEQMPMFLASFLVFTLLVDPIGGARVGFLYCFFLSLYPVLHDKENLTKVFASTFPRYLMIMFMIWSIIFSALKTEMPSPAPAPSTGGYHRGESRVYSNSKYLADFQVGMSMEKCGKYCDNWGVHCEDICDEKKECGLSDSVDARHFTRETSCQKECVGFNMHEGAHCTLFSDNVKLLKGGDGTFYSRPGKHAPEVQSLFSSIVAGEGIVGQKLLTPFLSVIGVVLLAGLGLLAARWARHPLHFEVSPDTERLFASEE